MPSLFSGFYSKRLQMSLVSLSAMLAVNVSVHAEQGAVCNPSPVFAFSQALYWQQYQRANHLLQRLARVNGATMATFLAQVLKWKRGYDRQNVAHQIQALNQVDHQIAQLEATLQQTPSAELETMVGNIMLHAARMNLVMSRVFRAAKLAKRGNFLISNVLRHNPNAVDALLTAGLFQYYAGNAQNGFAWVKRWFDLQGDQKYGRQLIQRAMRQSPDFAFEAARSLKMELDWNKQDVCRYPVLIPATLTPQAQSIEAVQLEITTDLFCGRTQAADQLIQQIEPLLGSASPQINRWFIDARLYALAQAGEVEALSAMDRAMQGSDDVQARLRIQFSLAKALDVRGEHGQSQPIYLALLDSTLEDIYKKLANKYLAGPYRTPVKIEPEIILVACSER